MLRLRTARTSGGGPGDVPVNVHELPGKPLQARNSKRESSEFQVSKEGLLHEAQARVPAAGVPQIAFFKGDQIVDGRDEAGFLLEHEPHPCIVELEHVIGRIDPRGEAAPHAFSAVGVASHLQPEPVGLVHDRLDGPELIEPAA